MLRCRDFSAWRYYTELMIMFIVNDIVRPIHIFLLTSILLFACRWFCHFDDDNYVNIPRLVDLLNDYSPSVDWYLGKPSIASPLEIFVDTVSSELKVSAKTSS